MSAQLEGLAYGYSLAYPRDRAAYEAKLEEEFAALKRREGFEYCLREAERAEKAGNEKSAQQWLEAAVWAEGQL